MQQDGSSSRERAERFLLHLADSTDHDVRSAAQQLRGLYEKRLWYQSTLALEQFISLPKSAPYQIDLFRLFVADFDRHLNQLRYVDLSVRAARHFEDGRDACSFLDSVAGKVDTPSTQDAYVLASMEAAHYRLMMGDLDAAKKAMSRCSKLLEGFDSIDRLVSASFYRVSGDYHKAKAEYGDYYKTSLLYLACVDLETCLSLEEHRERAHDLALAALLGPTIYNFGELLLHPVLDSLKDTADAWLRDLLFVFNDGAIGKFESIAPQFDKDPILAESKHFLRQKICLMALIEAVFKRPAGNRIMPFTLIASETRLPEHEVEHLIMKALALKLVHGSLDQVAQTAQVTWVQPRVLNKHQINGLRGRLEGWSSRVGEASSYAQRNAGELAVQ